MNERLKMNERMDLMNEGIKELRNEVRKEWIE